MEGVEASSSEMLPHADRNWSPDIILYNTARHRQGRRA